MHVRFTLTSRGVPLITNDVLQYFFMMSFNSLITVVSLIVFASRILSLPSIFHYQTTVNLLDVYYSGKSTNTDNLLEM